MARNYTVLAPASPSDGIVERAERMVFVREGFAWLALLFPLIWLLVHRMWLVFLGFIVLLVGVQVAVMALGAGETGAMWSVGALNLLFAFQANDLRRWTLERRGFEVVGAVTGRTALDCERRFFSQWLAGASRAAGGAPEPLAAAGPVAEPAS